MISLITCLRFNDITNLLHLSNEWEEVYKNTYLNETYSQNKTYIGYSGDFYVCNVYFSKLGNEGVIIFESRAVRSLISTCTFENSTRINNVGGSIYINYGQIFIRKVCSFGSKANNSGDFCKIAVIYNSSSINEIHDSSIAYSKPISTLNDFSTITPVSYTHLTLPTTERV